MTGHCEEYLRRVSEYLDGELDPEVCDKIERHLRQCPECMNCLKTLKKSIELCKEAAQEKMPFDARARLRTALGALFTRERP